MVRVFLAPCLIFLFSAVSPQDNPFLFDLNKAPDTSRQPYDFYIQNVEDVRTFKGGRIGTLLTNGSMRALVMQGNTENELFDYWRRMAPFKQDLLPVYVSVRKLEVNEKPAGTNKINGEITLSLAFRWYRDMNPVQLTSFQTNATYSRPEGNYLHDDILHKLLNQAMVNFSQWMKTNQGKNPALLRNLILTFHDIKPANEEDTVFYSPDRPLIWDDFRAGNVRPGSRFAAAVFTNFAYEGSSYPNGNDLVVDIGLKVFMIKSNSWARDEAKNGGSLRHEQIHFDIVRLSAERFKDRLRRADLTIEDNDSEIQYQFLEAFREMNEMQKAYDEESGHGQNRFMQAEWDKKVARQIAQLYESKPKESF